MVWCGGGCGAQNFFTYFYGAVFNLMGLAAMYAIDGGVGPTLLQGHNTVTVMLIVNNAAQGILSSFFFKVRAPTHSTLGACGGGGQAELARKKVSQTSPEGDLAKR